MAIRVFICPNCKTIQIPHEKYASLITFECPVCKKQFSGEENQLELAETRDLARGRQQGRTATVKDSRSGISKL